MLATEQFQIASLMVLADQAKRIYVESGSEIMQERKTKGE